MKHFARRLKVQDNVNTDYVISGRYKFKIQDPKAFLKKEKIQKSNSCYYIEKTVKIYPDFIDKIFISNLFITIYFNKKRKEKMKK